VWQSLHGFGFCFLSLGMDGDGDRAKLDVRVDMNIGRCLSQCPPNCLVSKKAGLKLLRRRKERQSTHNGSR
jgi:hypothetical protein